MHRVVLKFLERGCLERKRKKGHEPNTNFSQSWLNLTEIYGSLKFLSMPAPCLCIVYFSFWFMPPPAPLLASC